MAIVPRHIILSRTDSIGDVMLTLPLAGLLKEIFPGVRITFLGRSYTAPVIHRCRHVDSVLTLEEIGHDRDMVVVEVLRRLEADVIIHVYPDRRVAGWAKQAGIAHRIGTSHRWWNIISCNHRVGFSRKGSDLHEAQLNVKLLEPFGEVNIPELDRLADLSGFLPERPDDKVAELLHPGRKHVIIHPYSKGSAVEWGMDRYAELIDRLDPQRYQVLVTGTASEAERYRDALAGGPSHVTDTGGRLSLNELIQLIAASDALVAASTGPLHIAAASGIRAIGLYSSVRPIHPGRWAPLGSDVHVLTAAEAERSKDPQEQVRAIDPGSVLKLLEDLPVRS